MRKLVAAVLSLSLVMGFAACGKKDDKKNDKNEDNKVTVTVAPSEDASGIITPDVKENTAGSALWNAFLETMKANPETAAIDVANTLSTNPVIQFMAGAMEVEPGFLAGFDEEIKDFEKAAMFGPMMGSIAFAGYVFELAEGADVNAFVENLKSKANPRWNICVSADYTQVGAYENTVYFLMYPETMDSQEGGEAGGDIATDAAVIYPEVAENTWGEMLWEAFETHMNDNPETTAVDAAFILSMHESIAFSPIAMEVEPGLLTGFDNAEITGFESGAVFAPMIGSMAFIGYVFELEDGADVNGFMNTLEGSANPAWNVCVTADQTVVGAYNNFVFFLMCPNSNQSE